MAIASNCLRLFVLTFALIIVEAGSKHRSESFTCRLLNSNYINSQPWLEYPIVFEPINRGRLTIWSGVSSLPGSEFKCYAGKNGTSAILLDFANFADKLEWTYFDTSKGMTFNGISINHRENTVYKIHIDNRQSNSPFECNRVDAIEPYHEEDWTSDIRSACKDCRSSIISLINSQISELFRLQLNDQIMDSLYWHLSQLISSQHFSGPIAL